MSGIIQSQGGVAFLIFVLAAICTELVRLTAVRFGFVSRPKENRWNKRTVALGGGIGILIPLLVGAAFWIPEARFGLLPSVALVFILGVVDDARGVMPLGKLLTQTLAAAWAVSQGFVFPLPWPELSILVSILWLVGMSNSLNLLDNMDGLAGGVVCIASAGFFLLFSQAGDTPSANVALVCLASTAGFLIHNWFPARIFMGDGGSLALGFLMAALATRIRGSHSLSPFSTFIPALLLVMVPLFDTCLVMIARSSARRPLLLGGRDHTSHRLVALGMSERKSVAVLYLISVVGVILARFAAWGSRDEMLIAGVSVLVALVLLGVFLLDVRVYAAASGPQPKQTLPVVVHYMLELALDIGIVTVSWEVAHYMRFQDQGLATYKALMVVPMLPFLVVIKLFVFAALKLYRGLWRSIHIEDVYRVFKASSLATLIVIALAALFTRLQDLSRMVLLVDWLLTFLGLLAVRAAISGFRRWSRKLAGTSLRAALLGSSSLAPLMREALKNDHSLELTGVITPTPESGNQDVLGSVSEIGAIIESREIDVLFVASQGFEEVLAALSQKGISIRSLKVLPG